MSYDLRQLRHFVAVARQGSFARAAETLGLAQPTLSRSIQALEQQIGARLLDRGRAGAQPTALGTTLLQRAEGLLRQSAEAEREMRLLAGVESGQLRIGAGAYAADISVAEAATRFLRKHPGIDLDVTIDDWTELVARLVEGEIDVAVAEASSALQHEQIEVELMHQHPGILFCRAGHPLLESRRPLGLQDLAPFAFVCTSIPDRLERTFATIQRHGHAAVRHRVDTFEIVRRIVLATDAIATAIPRQVAADLGAGRLAVLPIEFPGLHTAYGIMRLARRTASPAAQAFLQELREVEAEIVAAGPLVTEAG